MARPRNRFVDWLEYLGARLLAMFAQMFGPRPNYRAGRLVGEMLWRLDRRHRRIACEHVRLSFPDWPEDRVRRVARKSMHNLAYLGLEVLLTPRLITPTRWQRHVRLRNMSELLRLLIRQDGGIILLTGHFGNFEVVGYTMATLGFATYSVARPLDNVRLWEYLVRLLGQTGQRFLYKKGAMGAIPSHLDARQAVSFVADQDAGRRGLFVDFFGRPASTYKSIGLLAVRHKVPVAIGYGKRLDDTTFRFEVGVQRVIYPREWAGRNDAPEWVTREFTRELENIVRAAPEQYLWVHRRWKHRPDGTKAGGHGIA